MTLLLSSKLGGKDWNSAEKLEVRHTPGSSTRASSSNSPSDEATVDKALDPQLLARKLDDLSALAQAPGHRKRLGATVLATPAQAPRRKKFAFGLALLAVLGWLWQRRVNRLSIGAREFGFARILVAMYALATPIVRALGYKSGRSDLAIRDKIPEGQKVICFHPHGLFLIGNALNTAAAGFCHRREGDALEGMMIVGSDAVFDVPIANGLLLLANFRKAKRYVIDELLSNGKTVGLYPGGIHEQLRTDPGQERCFFPPNLGFIRDAMKHGVPLVPYYTFGENQLYDTPQWTRSISEFLKQKLGVGMPLGIGRFGLPGVPKNVPLRGVLGRPVDVGPKGEDASEERLEEVFRRYCAELQRIFAEHKDANLPLDVAARGLEIIWRGREELTTELSLPPSAEGATLTAPSVLSPLALAKPLPPCDPRGGAPGAIVLSRL